MATWDEELEEERVEWVERGYPLGTDGRPSAGIHERSRRSEIACVGRSQGLARLDPELFRSLFDDVGDGDAPGADLQWWPTAFPGCLVLRREPRLWKSLGRDLVLSLHEQRIEHTGRPYSRHVWFVLPAWWSDDPLPERIGAACEHLLQHHAPHRRDMAASTIVVDLGVVAALRPPVLDDDLTPLAPATPSELMMAMVAWMRVDASASSWQRTLEHGIAVMCAPAAAGRFGLAMPATPLAVDPDWHHPIPIVRPRREAVPTPRALPAPRQQFSHSRQQSHRARIEPAISSEVSDPRTPSRRTQPRREPRGDYEVDTLREGHASGLRVMLGVSLLLGVTQIVITGLLRSDPESRISDDDRREAPVEVRVPPSTHVSQGPLPVSLPLPGGAGEPERMAVSILGSARAVAAVRIHTSLPPDPLSGEERALLREVVPEDGALAVVGFSPHPDCQAADDDARRAAGAARTVMVEAGYRVAPNVIVVGRRKVPPPSWPPRAPDTAEAIVLIEADADEWRQAAGADCIAGPE